MQQGPLQLPSLRASLQVRLWFDPLHLQSCSCCGLPCWLAASSCMKQTVRSHETLGRLHETSRESSVCLVPCRLPVHIALLFEVTWRMTRLCTDLDTQVLPKSWMWFTCTNIHYQLVAFAASNAELTIDLFRLPDLTCWTVQTALHQHPLLVGPACTRTDQAASSELHITSRSCCLLQVLSAHQT